MINMGGKFTINYHIHRILVHRKKSAFISRPTTTNTKNKKNLYLLIKNVIIINKLSSHSISSNYFGQEINIFKKIYSIPND